MPTFTTAEVAVEAIVALTPTLTVSEVAVEVIVGPSKTITVAEVAVEVIIGLGYPPTAGCAYRSSSSITLSSAGSSVTLTKPAGTVDTGLPAARDQLVAFVASVGVPTITAPTGWTLIAGEVDGGSGVKMSCYRKLATGEPSSWTWTLSSAQRAWGWVGAYSGVDFATPVASYGTSATLTGGTTLQVLASSLPANGEGVGAGAGVRTASGSATTWVTSSTERADVSTNAGSGIDITGVVADRINDVFVPAPYGPTFTASQAQSAGVVIVVALSPYTTPYRAGLNGTGLVVETAVGADLSADSSTWTWTNLSALGLVAAQGVQITRIGKANRAVVADPASASFRLLNLHGEFTHPLGTPGPLTLGQPFRVRLTGWGTGNYHRFTGQLGSATPAWDATTRWAVVDVVVDGRLRQQQQQVQPLHSAGYRTLSGTARAGFAPVAYWPFEDGVKGTRAASATPGVAAAYVSQVTFGAGAVAYAGSAPLAALITGSAARGVVPAYPATPLWCVVWALSLPSAPAAVTTLLEITTTGTAARWALDLDPGSGFIHLRAYDSSGTSLLNASAAVGFAPYYAVPTLYSVAVVQAGADVTYTATWAGVGTDDIGLNGTLTGQTAGNVTQWLLPGQPGFAGATFGHVDVYADVRFDATTYFAAIASALLLAHAGETPQDRVQRLLTEEGLPFRIDASDRDLAMGPQGALTLMALLRECETVETSVLNDAGVNARGTGRIWLPAADDRLNVAAALILDATHGDVTLFSPVLDDQDTVTDVTASRAGGGSSARARDATARVDIASPVTVNMSDDSHLADIAGWRVHLGTVAGMRFPAVKINFRRAPHLALTWVNTPLFSRVDIVNPPQQWGPGPIRAIIEGYSELISNAVWEATSYLSPYDPYAVGTLSTNAGDTSPTLGWLDWDACTLAASVTSSATTWTVTAIPTDTTLADDFPRDVIAASEQVTVTASAKAVADAFGRTVSSTWGALDTGQTWANTGGSSSDFSVAGGEGLHTHTAANTLHVSSVDVGATDMVVVVKTLTPVANAGGAPIEHRLAARYVDTSNYYYAAVIVTTTGDVQLTLAKVVAGTTTTLGPLRVWQGHQAGDHWSVQIWTQGSLIQAKAWRDGGGAPPEPVVHQLSVIDMSLTVGTHAACVSKLDSGSSDAPLSLHWDAFEVRSARTWTVVRHVNALVRAQSAGTSIQLANPLVLAM